jgi:hypothetical protein
MRPKAHANAMLTNAGEYGLALRNYETASVSSIIISCAKAICPAKTWAYLDKLLGVGEATAKHRIAGRRAFTADELATLLRTERGIDYLVAVMGEAEPAWWRKFKKHLRVESALRLQAFARRELEDAVDADRSLTAAIAGATAAMAVSDPDFHQPQIDAMAAAGSLHRPLAQAKRGR